MKEMNNDVVSNGLMWVDPQALEEFLANEDAYVFPEITDCGAYRALTPRQRARLRDVDTPHYVG